MSVANLVLRSILLSLLLMGARPATADLAEELSACRDITEDGLRLECFDGLAARTDEGTVSETADRASQALDREFTFSSRLLRDGPLGFRVPVEGLYSPANRAAAFPMPEVEDTAAKIGQALADFSGWHLAVSVRPAVVQFGRRTPYTGEELKRQAEDALSRSGLSADRYSVTTGEPAPTRLSGIDARRESSALVIIAIEGLK